METSIFTNPADVMNKDVNVEDENWKLKCVKLFKVITIMFQAVHIEIEQFDVEDHTECEYDYLKFGDDSLSAPLKV